MSVLDLDAPTIPGQSLGGLTLRTHISELQDLIRSELVLDMNIVDICVYIEEIWLLNYDRGRYQANTTLRGIFHKISTHTPHIPVQ